MTSRVVCAAMLGVVLGVCGLVSIFGGPISAAQEMSTDNPFFVRSSLPYQLPPFDRIDESDYLPAFERGMVDQLAEVEAIASESDPPTFENTLVPLERSGRLLERVAATFFSLSSADTTDALDEILGEVAPKLSAHSDRILLNADLFGRVQALYDQRDSLDLDGEARRLIEKSYVDFVRAGALLSETDKLRMQEINAAVATLQTTFTQNVLDEVNASAMVVDTRAELAGLSDDQIAAAAAAGGSARS